MRGIISNIIQHHHAAALGFILSYFFSKVVLSLQNSFIRIVNNLTSGLYVQNVSSLGSIEAYLDNLEFLSKNKETFLNSKYNFIW